MNNQELAHPPNVLTALMGRRQSLEHISEREQEILTLVSHGLTADEISTQLFISSNTVISHRKNLQRKLNARNTTHLVFLACQFGLI
ncbi:MAG: helix-turn-helix transcriptional regulator [Saprospiraceae bacterium]|jgi:DNA-binding CsgD family transcriptional regulator|nr:helix-turn-helix transcriptional regulator [Saprospiraceae bacterium]